MTADSRVSQFKSGIFSFAISSTCLVVTVFADRSYTFITKTPPAPVLLKRAANIAKGSAEPNKNKVGTVTTKQVEEIAKLKMPDLNCDTLEAAVKTVAGTARSMGLDVLQ